MRHLCVIGNSHVASLKMGFDLCRSQGMLPDVSVEMFASHQTSLSRCVVADGKMRPINQSVRSNFEWTSGGKGEIVLDDYDDIFVVAGASPHSLSLYVTNDGIPPLSRALVGEIVDAWAGDWACGLAATLARAGARGKVHFVGEPFASDASPLGERLCRLLNADDGALARRVADTRRRVAACLAEMTTDVASIVHPPGACLEPFGLFTRQEFCRGSVKLTPELETPHPDNDFWHMNALYGLELARHLFGGD